MNVVLAMKRDEGVASPKKRRREVSPKQRLAVEGRPPCRPIVGRCLVAGVVDPGFEPLANVRRAGLGEVSYMNGQVEDPPHDDL